MKSPPRTTADITPYGLNFTEGEPSDELIKILFPNYPNQQQIARFYAAIGQAISAWQVVETSLYVLYETATKPQIPGAAASAFHAIQTTNVKLAATDAAVLFNLLSYPNLSKEWQDLRALIDTKNAARNKLVHFSTYIMFNAKNEDEKIRLEPQLHDYRHVGKKKRPPHYKLSDIQARSAEFADLAKSIRVFSGKLSEAQTRSSPSPSQD